MEFFWRLSSVCCFVLMHGVVFAACPSGYMDYPGPVLPDVARNSSGQCVPLCARGGRKFALDNGYRFNLFDTKTTFPSVHVQLPDGICYIDLLPGNTKGTVNVAINNGDLYHMDSDVYQPCKVGYELSFSCGEGATGTPPSTYQIGWGDLFTVPAYSSGCQRAGHTITGWAMDSDVLSPDQVYEYSYDQDKELVAQWSANTYGAPYLCNYCAGSTGASVQDYVRVRFGGSFQTLSGLECTNLFSKNLDGWRVLDPLGNDTGVFLTPGQATDWVWDDNMQLSAVWSGGVFPREYVLSYSCGDGATGTPPAAHTIKANQLFSTPANSGTCSRTEHHITGWSLDSEILNSGTMYPYTYTTSKTMVAQWTPNEFAAVYLCYNDQESQYFLSAYYGDTVKPGISLCAPPTGKKLSGYQIWDVFGTDTGDFVAAGDSFVWTYANSLMLRAVWVDSAAGTE